MYFLILYGVISVVYFTTTGA